MSATCSTPWHSRGHGRRWSPPLPHLLSTTGEAIRPTPAAPWTTPPLSPSPSPRARRGKNRPRPPSPLPRRLAAIDDDGPRNVSIESAGDDFITSEEKPCP